MTPRDDRLPRLLLLGDARQVHLRRWAKYFVDSEWRVETISLEAFDRFPGASHRLEVTTRLPHALRYPIAVPAARRIAASFQPHVVNAHFVPNYGTMALLMRCRTWVLSTWGSDVMTDPTRTPFHGWRARRVLRAATWVTSDAEVMSRRVEELGVSREKILTFPYGVDAELFHPGERALTPSARIVTNRKLESVYDVGSVIDAFSGVREAIPDAALTVAGDGALRAALMERARRSLGAAGIVFVGNVEHDRMPALLREHDIYVSAARSDTTSVSLLEAMSCGLFPIVTDIPANREWIEHGRNGYLVPAGEPMRMALALVEACRNPDLCEEARRRNLEIVRTRAVWTDNMKPVRELFARIAGIE